MVVFVDEALVGVWVALTVEKSGASVVVGASPATDYDVRLFSFKTKHFLDSSALRKSGFNLVNVWILLQRSLITLVPSILAVNIFDPLHNEDGTGVEVADDAAVEVRMADELVQ